MPENSPKWPSDATSTGAALATALRVGEATRDGLVKAVQTLGSVRSTGAKLATLHAAPVERATLAWFGLGSRAVGGGRWAVGGGGMAAGKVFLTAVVITPPAAVIAYKAAPAIKTHRAKRAAAEPRQDSPETETPGVTD